MTRDSQPVPGATSLMPYPDILERLDVFRDTSDNEALREMAHDAADTIRRLSRAYVEMKLVLALRRHDG
jgi:hypothetical protein